MDTLYSLIINDMKHKVLNLHRYTDELYGYSSDLPEYRVIMRKLYVDYRDSNGNIVKNVLLECPKSPLERDRYKSLIELRIYTGLLYLPLQLDDLMVEEFGRDLCVIIDGMYDNEYDFVAFRLVVEKSMIEEMYEQIAHVFEIV
ncbi:hypothetical protein [Erysipelothrix anatis]|uniref:hypothetical protein n=1 Tax=Erysipelothrix anatis TaxID=2683713 RepID=UPI0014096E02|nr:hypothetical protein [Erysipelothrix anatis]